MANEILLKRPETKRVQTTFTKNVVIYADFRMKAVCRKKIVALNRSIRKNLIKMKEFTRTP